MIKIALTTTPLSSGSKTRGIGVYTRELMAALSRLKDLKIYPSSQNPYRLPVDLVHYPFFDLFYHTLPLKPSLPTVVTIHDVIPLKYPAHFPVGLRGRLGLMLQKLSLRSIHSVITDSESSKKDIAHYLSFNPDRIFVVPLAPARHRGTVRLSGKVRDLYQLPAEYLLYVGDINWNKNIPGLLQALSKMVHTDAHLVCVGKVFADKPDIPEYRAIIDTIQALDLNERVHLLSYVPSHHLPVIYRLAKAYVQPSWDEGFGLTILEAMTMGTPVVSSNRGSLPEVGGEAALYFDPDSIKEFSRSLDRIWEDKALRTQLTSLGESRVKQYSWEQTARATAAVYAQLH